MRTYWYRVRETFVTALRLGLTSFGGPAAHIGYFHKTYVQQLKWLDDQQFAELQAISQMLPGPSSSQLGIGIGMRRAGWLGGAMAWLGFTLPSACLLALFALGISWLPNQDPGWLQGLKLAAVPIIIQALWGMNKQLTPDALRRTIAIIAAILSLLLTGVYGQLLIMGVALAAGVVLFRNRVENSEPAISTYRNQYECNEEGKSNISRTFAKWMTLLFFGLLIGLPMLAYYIPNVVTQLMEIMYRTGSAVFGGGHVVLPVLKHELMTAGLLDDSSLLAGYGAAQAVPGPLFTFAAFVGATIYSGGPGIVLAIVATLFIFLPSYLLMGAVLPYMSHVRQWRTVRAAFQGINAAVVGLLLAALYDPVFTTSVTSPIHMCIVLIGILSLIVWKQSPWITVLLSVMLGMLLL
ncbi:chromate efflux transporter [Paenibacillus alvei]|uniref:Chromate transporter n=1 Tax=Paenibacillus alvei TaxID=44250 RepID=A0A383RDP8_PAEAL|nr:chromate efflux transporter [Paenibacillus alvei]SYX84376.1 Chromate transporter [Paenibacillus alvei]